MILKPLPPAYEKLAVVIGNRHGNRAEIIFESIEAKKDAQIFRSS